jgi:hypothetical protein
MDILEQKIARKENIKNKKKREINQEEYVSHLDPVEPFCYKG